MILVPFDYIIPEKERNPGMTSVPWWIELGEMPGVLNWAIAGMRRLINQGGFSRCEVAAEAVAEYRLDSNPAKEFLSQHIAPCEHGVVDSGLLFELYCYWCTKMHRTALGHREFGKEVHRVFPQLRRRRTQENGDRVYKYEGIAWLTDKVLDEPVDRRMW